LDDGTIGIIVEEGKWDGNLPGEDGFNLGFYRFSIDWLLEGDNQ
jgi:sialidase-1